MATTKHILPKSKTADKTESKLSICVTGAIQDRLVEATGIRAQEVGRQIAGLNHTVVTETMYGIPYLTAEAAKQAGGMSVGFSPAISSKEHSQAKDLSRNAYDFLVYTGSDAESCTTLMLRSVQAVIFVCGRIGNLHEINSLMEEHKIVGVLMNPTVSSHEVAHIVSINQPGEPGILYESDPARLVAKVVKAAQIESTGTAQTSSKLKKYQHR